jgi:hypothetical protein
MQEVLGMSTDDGHVVMEQRSSSAVHMRRSAGRVLALGVLLTVATPCAARAAQGAPAQTAAPAKAQDPAQPPAAKEQAPAQTADGAKTEQAPGQAAETKAEAKSAAFDAAHLEQIVAPIALHPDGLLSQILMASTYPLEIVEAARWMEKNPKLTGDKLEAALKEKDWEASVKSLCGFPSVLKQMNENLDWTQDLGDAFLGQKSELMDAVQAMRKKALDAGTLKTTEQQTVKQEGQIIIVESADPEVIYVPTYSPTVVYGSAWGYPTYYYPPMYYPPPPGSAFISFGVGVFWGAAIFGDCDWDNDDIEIDIDHEYDFEERTGSKAQERKESRSGKKESFQHDASHRKGVNYRDSQTASKYNRAGTQPVSRDQARGYDRAGPSSGRAPTASDRANAPSARTSGTQPPRDAARNAPSTSNRAGGSASRATTGASRASSGGNRASQGMNSGAFSGSRSPSLDRSASSRGSASRGGGGRGGGGGRRR